MGRHVFGPVASRRLGRSLGVDIVPFKTCSYDCIYCQLGRTTCRTTERRAWVNPDDVLSDLSARLASCTTPPDWITFSGSGEPTLHSGIGDLISGIRARTSVPIAVLTNGSLLWQEDVREQLRGADLVIPSLDAGDPALFVAVNRPCPGVEFDRMVAGLQAFRRQFRGQCWLEVMLVRGFTDTPQAVEAMSRIARHIGPDRIQVNTVVRPPAEAIALPVPPEVLAGLVSAFGPKAEGIAAPPVPHEGEAGASGVDDLLEMLRRRPRTAGDVAAGLGIHPASAGKLLGTLVAEGIIETVAVEGRTYFKVGKTG